MRVFLSFAQTDSALAAQLETAFRRNGIETWSTLDLTPGTDWRIAVDSESARSEVYAFLVGTDQRENYELLTQWRLLFRNDFESKKLLVPIIPTSDAAQRERTSFLPNRRPIVTSDFDRAAKELLYLMKHPSESIDHSRESEARIEWQNHVNKVKEFALSLKASNGSCVVQ